MLSEIPRVQVPILQRSGKKKKRLSNVYKKNLTQLRPTEIKRSSTSRPSSKRKEKTLAIASVKLRRELKKLKISKLP